MLAIGGVKLLDSATSGTGTAVDCQDANTLALSVVGVGTISAGTLVWEEAHDAAFAGTWSAIQTIDLTTLTGGGTTGVEVVTHPPIGCYRGVRPRITVAVTGASGAVTAYVNGNGSAS